MNVEIHAAGVNNPKALKLVAPERIVIDLPNAVAVNHFRQVPVHSPDIKTVRMSQYQSNPPVTRVVVDLASPQSFEVVNSGRIVTLRMHPLGQRAQMSGLKQGIASAVNAPPNKKESSTLHRAPRSLLTEGRF